MQCVALLLLAICVCKHAEKVHTVLITPGINAVDWQLHDFHNYELQHLKKGVLTKYRNSLREIE